MRPDSESDETKPRMSTDPQAAAARNASRDRLRLIQSRWAELRAATG
jgi:hypothetical protein